MTDTTLPEKYERLREKYMLDKEVTGVASAWGRARLDILELLDDLQALRNALEWYADPIAYSMPVQDMKHHVFPDMGATARAALARLSSPPAPREEGER